MLEDAVDAAQDRELGGSIPERERHLLGRTSAAAGALSVAVGVSTVRFRRSACRIRSQRLPGHRSHPGALARSGRRRGLELSGTRAVCGDADRTPYSLWAKRRHCDTAQCSPASVVGILQRASRGSERRQPLGGGRDPLVGRRQREADVLGEVRRRRRRRGRRGCPGGEPADRLPGGSPLGRPEVEAGLAAVDAEARGLERGRRGRAGRGSAPSVPPRARRRRARRPSPPAAGRGGSARRACGR